MPMSDWMSADELAPFSVLNGECSESDGDDAHGNAEGVDA